MHLVDVRRALESQPNISQHVTAMFLTLDTTHKGKVTFRDLLKVLYGKASNEDINTMLHWVARRPKPPPKPIEKPALTREQRDEMLAMFALYDKNTDGALTIKELAAAMAETHALEPHDIERIFVDVGKGRTESISSEEVRADRVRGPRAGSGEGTGGGSCVCLVRRGEEGVVCLCLVRRGEEGVVCLCLVRRGEEGVVCLCLARTGARARRVFGAWCAHLGRQKGRHASSDRLCRRDRGADRAAPLHPPIPIRP